MRVALFLVLGFMATPALADGSASWEAFRVNVEAACLALVDGQPGQAVAEVNPFGSMSYGVAIVTLSAEGGTDRMVCIFNKTTGAVEMTTPFTNPDK